MIKFVTPEEHPGVRTLLKECFGFDEAWLDLYLERNPASRRMCCVEDGRVVAFLAAFPLDYVSGELVGGVHRTWHGYYLHGMCTAPACRISSMHTTSPAAMPANCSCNDSAR